MVKYNYEERGQKAVIAKPSVDTRDGTFTIKSRIGLSTEGITVEKLLTENKMNYDAIIIDEAQFMAPEQVDALAEIADSGTPVICYGLRTDFQGKFFPGSLRLMEVADTIEEIKTVCWCGRKATINARYDKDGNVVRDGDQVVLGANDQYIAVCRKHFHSGELFGVKN